METSTNIYAILVLSCLYGLYRRFSRPRGDLGDVRGPEPQSFWLGEHFWLFASKLLRTPLVQEISGSSSNVKPARLTSSCKLSLVGSLA